MLNKIAGYRKMASMTQKEMSNCLDISVNQYRAKEKGRYDFSRTEMEKFYLAIRKTVKNVNVQDIFFEY